MGLFKALSDSVTGMLGDQWLETISTGSFDEHTAVLPGMVRSKVSGLGTNYYECDGVISEGSHIFVPENTAAFIFGEGGIEEVITIPGDYEYNGGTTSVFSGGGLDSMIDEVGERFSYGGIPSGEKRIAFVNLREIRDIKFGTRGPQVYFDNFYGVDLEMIAFGNYSIQIIDPTLFIRNYLPANTTYYSFDDPYSSEQISSEFLQSFSVALNAMSGTYRMSEIQGHVNEIADAVLKDECNAGTWGRRFGFVITKVAIENIEYTQESRNIVNRYSADKMKVSAYENVSQKAANIAAQQKIARGIEKNGLGNATGMFVGMNIAQSIGGDHNNVLTIDQQIEAVNKLKALMDEGVLTQEEFNQKKKEVMGL